MKFDVSQAALTALEAELDAATGANRLTALATLAWQLRQRDSGRALILIAEAERRLAAHPLPLAAGRALTARLALARCEIAALFCRLTEAEAALAMAREHLEPRLDAFIEGDTQLIEAALAKASGQRVRELAALARGLALFEPLGDPQRIGIARGLALCENIITGQDDGREAVVADLPPSADAATAALALAAKAYLLCLREPAEAAELFSRAAELAQGMGMVRFACIVTMNAGNAWLEVGALNSATQCFEAAAAQAQKTGWPALLGCSQTQVGRALRQLGRFNESLAVLNQALALLRSAPPGTMTALACSELALTLMALNLMRESVPVMAEANSLLRAARSNGNLALNLIRQARAFAALGQGGAALEAIAEAQALGERYGYVALGVDAFEVLAVTHRLCKLPAPVGMTAPTATLHFLTLALTQGTGIRGWTPPADLLSALADAWADAGDMAQAYAFSRAARQAQARVEALKMKNPRAVLKWLRDGAGGDAGEALAAAQPDDSALRETPLPAEFLTPKELEILHLLARNYANKEIALALGVSAETVKWHLKGLYTKLDAGSRKHAVTRGRVLGMLSTA